MGSGIMADVQIDGGNFTRIANEILENIAKAKLNGTQYAIVITVWRFTYGYQRKEAEFSLSFLSKETGIHRNQIQPELIKLIERNILIITQEATWTSPQVLKFNKDYDQWRVLVKTLTVSENTNRTVSENTNRGVSEFTNHIKKDKENIKESIPPIIPPKEKPPKHKYGEYQNVLLTDDEYARLVKNKGQILIDQAIKFLDEYIEEKGYKSKSHNLAIQRWVIDAVKKQRNKASPTLPNAFSTLHEWSEEE